jgi:hypothetical protein
MTIWRWNTNTRIVTITAAEMAAAVAGTRSRR